MKVLILCMVLIVALSLGCSKETSKEEGTQQDQTSKVDRGEPVRIAREGSLIDPVSGNPVDIDKVPYNFVYNNIRYHFESKENMEAFKKNPEKYLMKE